MALGATLDNPHIRADVVEVEEFPALARTYNVRGVPKTVVNEVIQFVGALPEDQFVAKVLEVGGKEQITGAHLQTAEEQGGQSTPLG